MVMAKKFSKMGIDILVNTSMELQTDMANIFGQMEVHTREILSMELDTGMGSGRIKNKLKFILDVIEWIKKRDLEFTNGLENRYTKVNSDRIFVKDLADFIK